MTQTCQEVPALPDYKEEAEENQEKTKTNRSPTMSGTNVHEYFCPPLPPSQLRIDHARETENEKDYKTAKNRKD